MILMAEKADDGRWRRFVPISFHADPVARKLKPVGGKLTSQK
jgi:hypothetical protein